MDHPALTAIRRAIAVESLRTAVEQISLAMGAVNRCNWDEDTLKRSLGEEQATSAGAYMAYFGVELDCLLDLVEVLDDAQRRELSQLGCDQQEQMLRLRP